MTITPRESLNQFKIAVFILEIDLTSSRFSRSSSQVSDDKTSIEARQKGVALKVVAPACVN